MKRKVLIVGIGAGNPEHMTAQAIDALNRADVLFIPHKGEEKQDLARLRQEICERFLRKDSDRLVDFDVPAREQSAGYRESVARWHEAIADIYARLLGEELGDGELGAFLIWGDPSLYDSTMRVLDRIRAKGEIALEYEVIPGISAVQALAAAHKIPLNRIGESVLLTTGRKLTDGFPEGVDSVVVMLDGDCAFKKIDGETEIYWGAYLGTSDEILITGRLREVGDEIERVRTEARARKGWILDTYLLRKPARS